MFSGKARGLLLVWSTIGGHQQITLGREYKRGKYRCTVDPLFDWFAISCMTTDNFCFYFQNRLIQSSQAGGQWYSDNSPFSILCSRVELTYSGNPTYYNLVEITTVKCLMIQALSIIEKVTFIIKLFSLKLMSKEPKPANSTIKHFTEVINIAVL
jgi:hypothetical protein